MPGDKHPTTQLSPRPPLPHCSCAALQELALLDSHRSLHFTAATVAASALVAANGLRHDSGDAGFGFALDELLALAPYLCEADVRACATGLGKLQRGCTYGLAPNEGSEALFGCDVVEKRGAPLICT